MQAMYVVIAPDKFKGTLKAREAAEAIARGWARQRPADRLELMPIADGGDGFGEVLSSALGARPRMAQVVDAAHRPCRAMWWWEASSRTAIMESARVVGLAMLPAGRYHPFELDTYGLGLLLRRASRAGARRVLVGIGGSATNDGAFGMARGLGWQFVREDGSIIEKWTELQGLASVRPPLHPVIFEDVLVAVDVQNQLLGRLGASRVYGPQKGLRPEDFERAEGCLRALAAAVKALSGIDISKVSGSGAAGGLGFGFSAFVGARLEPGFELLAERTQLEQRLQGADLVITGEGSLDASSLMGKGVGQLAERCRRLGVPCVALAGTVARGNRKLFLSARGLVELTTPEQARSRADVWLERLAEEVAAATPELLVRKGLE